MDKVHRGLVESVQWRLLTMNWVLCGLAFITVFGFLIYVGVDSIVNFEDYFLK